MRSKTKKLILAAGGALCAGVLTAGATGYALTANAEEAATPATVESLAKEGLAVRGAAIRYQQNDTDKGIRFSVSLSQDLFDKLEETEGAKMGILMIPHDSYTGKLDTATANVKNEVFYAPAADETPAVNDLQAIFNPKAEETATKEAVLVLRDDDDLGTVNYNRFIDVAGYVTDGVNTYYTDVKSMCIAEVAKEALAELGTDTTHKTELEAYLLKYNVTFYDYLGTAFNTQQVTYGEDFTVPVTGTGYYVATGKTTVEGTSSLTWATQAYDFTAEGAKETRGNMYFKADRAYYGDLTKENVRLTSVYDLGFWKDDNATYSNDNGKITLTKNNDHRWGVNVLPAYSKETYQKFANEGYNLSFEITISGGDHDSYRVWTLGCTNWTGSANPSFTLAANTKTTVIIPIQHILNNYDALKNATHVNGNAVDAALFVVAAGEESWTAWDATIVLENFNFTNNFIINQTCSMYWDKFYAYDDKMIQTIDADGTGTITLTGASDNVGVGAPTLYSKAYYEKLKEEGYTKLVFDFTITVSGADAGKTYDVSAFGKQHNTNGCKTGTATDGVATQVEIPLDTIISNYDALNTGCGAHSASNNVDAAFFGIRGIGSNVNLTLKLKASFVKA